MQWAAAVLSKGSKHEPDGLRDLLNEHAIFLMAVFIATILLYTGSTDTPYSVEVLIMLHMFFGSVL